MDDPDAALVYTVTALPAYGDITVDGTALAAGGTFTQGDVDGSLVGFTSTTTDQGRLTDGFTFTLTDTDTDDAGAETSAPASFSVAINMVPVVGGDLSLTLNESGSVVITSADLGATDADEPDAALVYKVKELPVYGDITVDGTVLTAGGTFTQGDVDGGLVGFTSTTTDLEHSTMDGFTFTVTALSLIHI